MTTGCSGVQVGKGHFRRRTSWLPLLLFSREALLLVRAQGLGGGGLGLSWLGHGAGVHKHCSGRSMVQETMGALGVSLFDLVYR